MVDGRYLVDYASDAAFAVNEDMKIVGWNYGARRYLGYSRREALGRNCWEILRAVLPDGEAMCSPDCDAAKCFIRFQPFATISCRVRHKDGGCVTMAISSMVMPKRARQSGDGAAVAIVFLQVEAEKLPRSSPAPSPSLQIYALGRFGLMAMGNDLAVGHWERKQPLTLLKFLMHHLGRPVHRERLIELMWPDCDEAQGRERLKVTLYYLRHQLRDAGIKGEVIETVGSTYILKRGMAWIDSHAFEDLYKEGEGHARAGRADKAVQCLEEAQRLYRGDYLEEDLYTDWCAEERERLCEIYIDVLGLLADAYATSGSHASAAQICRSALVREPCREHLHRSLMDYLFLLGRRDQAIEQFQRCEKILANELGVEPSTETRRLHEKILHSAHASSATAAEVFPDNPGPRQNDA